MCGIIAVLRGPDNRPIEQRDTVLPPLAAAVDDLELAAENLDSASTQLRDAGALLQQVNDSLSALPGLGLLVFDRAAALTVKSETNRAHEILKSIDAQLDAITFDVEPINADLVEIRDALWAIERDRLRSADAVLDLATGTPEIHALPGLASIQTALSALDRLEVRGRDSAGIEIFVSDHNLPSGALTGDRFEDLTLRTRSVRSFDGHLSFVYKNAAEIGDLGDNTAALRSQICADELLQAALS